MAEVEVMSIPEEYTDRDGNTKTKWNEIGIRVLKDNGKASFKLHHIPGVWGCFFKQERSDNSGGNRGANSQRNRGGNNEPW